ncbi:MAG: hypothetical protein NTV72_02245 [Candidatus Taylorbacteria bacterium]|nr:hypothetical protein [Candidatus Taylorbacteria bacterium]
MSFELPITQMAKAKKAEKPEKTQEELRQVFLERIENIRASTLNKLDIYDEKLKKGEFDDQVGELAGSGENRKLQMRKEISNDVARLDKMKEILDSGEELPQETVSIEVAKTQNKVSLEAVFGKPKNEFVPNLIKPEDLDYAILKDDIDSDKFGEYTLNPDTQNLDFENILETKVFIPDLSAFNGKPFPEVFKYLTDTYSGTHNIPGVEYWKWLFENPSKSPPAMKDTKAGLHLASELSCCAPRDLIFDRPPFRRRAPVFFASPEF